MRPIALLPKAIAILALLLLPAAVARSQTLRVVAADDRGVTLRLSLPAYRLSAPSSDGRVELMVPGYAVTNLPGRPHLPYAQTLLALPPGAAAVSRVVAAGEEETRDGLRLALGARPVMREGGDSFGPSPALEPVPPILDGPWPGSPVELSEPATVRRQRLVAVQVRPFRYDEATGRLWVRHSITVRVDFTGASAGAGAAAPVTDGHWEPVFRNALANYEQGRRWREPQRTAAVAPAGGLLGDRAALPAAVRAVAAFDESQPEVRIKVDTTGVYAFPYDDLAAQGYPAGVPVGEVSLHRHEYAGPSDPPYVTIELPVEVDDTNANGVFDSGDAIVAFVPDWVERSGVTSVMQRDWGDAEVVYATRILGGAGLRPPTRAGWRDAVGPALPTSYPWTQRWEHSTSYFAYPSPVDTATVDRFLWTSYFFYYNRPDSIRFETNDLDASHAVAFRTQLLGKDSNPHVMFGQIKNGLSQLSMVVDSLVWISKDVRTVSVALPGTALTEGLTNTIALWGKGSTLPPDPATNYLCNAGLDWFEATYWRSFNALGGYLAANSGDVTGAFQVHATGFGSPAIRVYDVTNLVSPVRLTVDASHIAPAGSGYALDFQDSTDVPTRRYVVFDQPKPLPSGSYTAVTRRQLTAATGERDYVVVVPEAFQAAVAPLVALRQSEGLGTVVAPLESVNDEFNGGRKSRWAIKRFLRYAFERWNARFVVLVGDGSSDPRNLLGSAGTDWVPVALIPGPVSSGALGLEMIPSDPWYGCCLDEDPGCFYATLIEPDLYVGRLPVNSLQQARDVVAKLVAYEAFDPDETWRRRMVLLADDCYSGVSTFGGGGGSGYCFHSTEIVFRLLNQAVSAVIADSSGLDLARPEVLDLRSYLTDPTLYQVNGPGDTCRVDAGGGGSGQGRTESILRAVFNPILFQKLNAGVLWWNYQGHANAYVLSHEGFYRNLGSLQDRDNFLNDGKLFLFSAFSCHANAFADVSEANPSLGPSLGENMLTLPLRGAVASWASTGFEIVPASGSYHLNVEFARSLFEHPPHDDELGRGLTDGGARVPLGEAIALTMLNYLPTVANSSYNSPFERGVGLTYNLLGDPATRLWVGPAQITVTANGQPVTNGQPVRLSSGGDALHLEAELGSNVAIDTIVVLRADASGTTVLSPSLYTLTPAFPDTAVSGQGGRHYHLSYLTTLSTGQETFTLRLTDRYGVRVSFDIVFEFRTQLFASGVPIQANDVVAPDAALTLLVLSPGTLNADSLRLLVDGASQSFTYELARGDTSGRQYVLSWTHAPYADGEHVVRLEVPGGLVLDSRFRVENHFALRDALAFPNPFDDELGTRFVFTLTGEFPADVLVRVYTVSGRRIYETRLDGLLPGHHEIPWDGLDAEGQKLANGVYFYKLVAHGPSGTSAYDGRLVKLRRPRHVPDAAGGGTP